MPTAAGHAPRRRAVDVHAEDLARARAAEVVQGQKLIDDFVRAARARALPTVPLVAHAYNGRSRYRTGLRGWYIHSNRLFAIGEDGAFYVLMVPPSLAARIGGAKLVPAQPRLTIGAGGKDGESMPLETLLRRRLDATAHHAGQR